MLKDHIPSSLSTWHWRCKQCDLSKYLEICAQWKSVTTEKTWILSNTALRT